MNLSLITQYLSIVRSSDHLSKIGKYEKLLKCLTEGEIKKEGGKMEHGRKQGRKKWSVIITEQSKKKSYLSPPH